MKKLTVLALFLLFALPGLADQMACELSQKSRLSNDLLAQLTEKICTHPVSSDPDIYMEYESKQKSLTPSQYLVWEYSDNCYKQMNTELFKPKDQDASTVQLAGQLDAILCDYPIYTLEVFRGANLPEDVAEAYLKADEITLPAFTSTSKVHRIGCEFAQKGNTFFSIVSKSGRVIENLSKHEQEEEVLFRLNTRFKVLSHATGMQAFTSSSCKGVSYYFELEEIN